MSTPIVQHAADLRLGFLHLTGFGFAMMCAFGVAHYVSQVVLFERGDDPEIMNDVTFAALVGTIVGAKVYYAILVGEARVLDQNPIKNLVQVVKTDQFSLLVTFAARQPNPNC